MNQQPDDILIQTHHTRRIKLIPVWVKIFSWIFIVFGCAVIIGLVYAMLGNTFELSIYGFDTLAPFSLVGIGIMFVFILKGLVAFGLLKEKDWAIKLGYTDAVLGIAACCFAMIYPLVVSGNFSFRLELIVLIPYLIKLDKIKKEWEVPEAINGFLKG